MRHIFFTILAALAVFSAAAQEPDTTSNVVGEKLDFDAPQVISETYFENVKFHLSKEGRKAWKPEFSVRINAMAFVGTIDMTAGIRTSPNKVFGIYAGRAAVWHDAIPAHSYRLHLCLYHRHYIPIDRKRRFSLYSDLLGGGSYTYKVSSGDPNPPSGNPQEGVWTWWYSWQPGISIRMWGKSNIFLGPTIGPSIGAHLGIAI